MVRVSEPVEPGVPLAGTRLPGSLDASKPLMLVGGVPLCDHGREVKGQLGGLPGAKLAGRNDRTVDRQVGVTGTAVGVVEGFFAAIITKYIEGGASVAGAPLAG